MIIDLIIILLSLFIQILVWLLSIVVFTIPTQVFSAITYFLGLLNYSRGIFDITVFFQALGSYLIYVTIWYTFKLLLWAYHHIPWFGKSKPLPKLHR